MTINIGNIIVSILLAYVYELIFILAGVFVAWKGIVKLPALIQIKKFMHL